MNEIDLELYELEKEVLRLQERLKLAEDKLAEQGIIWEDGRYVFDGKD
jgi:hypothetical protein